MLGNCIDWSDGWLSLTLGHVCLSLQSPPHPFSPFTLQLPPLPPPPHPPPAVFHCCYWASGPTRGLPYQPAVAYMQPWKSPASTPLPSTSARCTGLSPSQLVQKHKMEKQTQKAWEQSKGKKKGEVCPSHQGYLTHQAERDRLKQASKELAVLVQNSCLPHTAPTHTHPILKQRVGTWWMCVKTMDTSARYSFSYHLPCTPVAF